MRFVAQSLRWLVLVAVLLAGGYLGYCYRINDLSLSAFAPACLLITIATWWAYYVAFQKPPRDETVKLYVAIKRRVGAKSGNSFVADGYLTVVPRRLAIQRDVETIAIACHDLNAPLARVYVIHPCGFVHKTLRRVDATTIVSHPPRLCLRHAVHHLWALLPVQTKEIRELAGYYAAA